MVNTRARRSLQGDSRLFHVNPRPADGGRLTIERCRSPCLLRGLFAFPSSADAVKTTKEGGMGAALIAVCVAVIAGFAAGSANTKA